MKNVKKQLLVFSGLLVLLYYPCYAENHYTINETQLERLKNEIATLENLTIQQEQELKECNLEMMKLNNILTEQAELLKKSKNKELKTNIIIGSCCFCVGGVVASAIILSLTGR